MPRNLFLKAAFSLLFAALMCAGGSYAWAQTTEVKKPALKEIPAEYQPNGLMFRGFRYMPSLMVASQYDSNIYATDRNERSDIVTSIRPNLSVSKDYKGLFLDFKAGGDFKRYAEYDSENKNGYNFALDGNFEANSRMKFPFSISHTTRARDRADPLGTGLTTSEPLRVRHDEASFGVVRRFNRLSLGLIGRYGLNDLEDGADIAGTPVIFSDNNRSEAEGRIELTYEFLRGENSSEAPEHYLYAVLRRGHQDFEKRSFDGTDFAGLKRDRGTMGGLVGFQTNYKDKLLANIGAGYMQQDFEEASLGTTGTYDLKADIDYLLTPKWMLGFKAGREIAQDNDVLRGIVRSQYALTSQYELLHNMYFDSALGYGTDDFTDTAREDENVSGKLGLSYVFSPRLKGTLEGFRMERESSEAGRDMDRSVVMIGIKGAL